MADAGKASRSLSREEQLALWKEQKKKGDKKQPHVRTAGVSRTPPTDEGHGRSIVHPTVETQKRPSPSVRLSLSSSKASSSRPPTARRPLQPSPNTAVGDANEPTSRSTPSFLLETTASRRRRQSLQAPPLSNGSRHQRTPLRSHSVNVTSGPRKSKSVLSAGPTPVPARILLRPPRSTSPLSCSSSGYIHDDEDEPIRQVIAASDPRYRDISQAETPADIRVEQDEDLGTPLGGSFSPEQTPLSQKEQLPDPSDSVIQISGQEDEVASDVLHSAEVENHEADFVCRDEGDERRKEALNISISDELPMLKSALEEFQRPEENFEWLYDEKSPEGQLSNRRSRRTDSSQLLLPIPSLREEYHDYKSPPLGNAITTPVFSEVEKFDWRDELSPIDVHPSRRRVNEPLLLPIPSLREQAESTPSTSTPTAGSSPHEDFMPSNTRAPPAEPDPLDTSQQEETVEVSPTATSGKHIPARFRQPPKVDNKTLLPCIAEDVDVDLSMVESLQDQVDRLLTERQTLANQLSAMRRSHEDRLSPFRDVFEELRVQRAKNTRLEQERKQVMQTVATLQTQVKATVQIAVDRATQLDKELEASNRRNAELEAELDRLRSTQQ